MDDRTKTVGKQWHSLKIQTRNALQNRRSNTPKGRTQRKHIKFCFSDIERLYCSVDLGSVPRAGATDQRSLLRTVRPPDSII